MAANQKTSWFGYLEMIKNKKLDLQQVNIEGIEKMLMFNTSFHSLFFHSIPMIYLLDYTTGKYLLMSKSSLITLGFEPTEWTEKGVDFTIDLYNEEDLRLYNEKIFPDRISLLKQIPGEEQKNYIFSYNYRVRNVKQEHVHLLQRNCFIKSDERGYPILSLGMVINMEHFRKGNSVLQVVEKINNNNSASETVFKKVYDPNNESVVFSKREKEVLLWVIDGYTSKEIANKMYLSEATVINHRKNMLQKSGTKNAAELISFAMLNYII